jgi:hypothetical protein
MRLSQPKRAQTPIRASHTKQDERDLQYVTRKFAFQIAIEPPNQFTLETFLLKKPT